ncbi:MAG: hypothetical protein FJZ13_00480 [Candidatus Omnitrophica bacterium]|nr:hypothetical protein [Candidatus Omnitrophota bacterium]
MDAYLQELQKALMPYLNSLQNFNFSYLNPLFWVFLLLLFLILLKIWQARKAFSFCAILAVILLATTKIEEVVARAVTEAGGVFDPLVIRIVSIAVIMGIALYYLMIRED